VISLNQNGDSSNALPEKRQPARKTLISNIANDVRVNIVGIAVSVRPLVLDDGTGQVSVRGSFEGKIGDTVMIIGRPMNVQSETYLSPEIIKRLPDAGWLSVRKKELGKEPKRIIIKQEPIAAKTEEHENDKHADLLLLIKKLDTGDGVEIEDLISKSTIKDCQPLIDHFIRCGEVFEVSPGKIKVLE